VDEPHGRQRFSVDIPGLLAALTEQFPEPLLCVRELVQNAADAGARRIDVDVAYDARRGLFRIQVHDDGRGMNAQEVEGYLTIGFSEKDPTRARGRFGVGKLSPYALGITRMVVETSDGRAAHRITFGSDGAGQLQRTEARPRGTAVRVYKQATRAEAERLTERTFQLVRERCGSLTIPLYVNGQQVNRTMGLPTAYAWSFAAPEGEGVIGLLAEPVQELMGGGIVLETGAPILGEEVSYVLGTSPRASTRSGATRSRSSAASSPTIAPRSSGCACGCSRRTSTSPRPRCGSRRCSRPRTAISSRSRVCSTSPRARRGSPPRASRVRATS
jgi:hypothetical protein